MSAKNGATNHPAALPAIVSDGVIQVVLETVKGSRNKIKLDEKSGLFKLSKVLAEGMVFPYDFGFVPSTKAADGDPLDVLVFMDEPGFPGCLVECRLIGVLEATQEEHGRSYRNDRLLAVAQASICYSEVTHLTNLNPTVLAQIEAFFVAYQKLRNVKFRICGRHGPEQALSLLQQARANC